MKGYILLLLSWAGTSAISRNLIGLDTMDVPEGLDIAEANKDIFHNESFKPQNLQRSVYIADGIQWTSPVPYVFNESLELNARGVILRAFDSFRVKSCIDFVPRISEEYYISVQKLNGCFSDIGKSEANGQVLSIGKRCDFVHIVEHEFLHALGFFHEQSRYDRDDYVTIVTENIQEDYKDNFEVLSRENSSTQGTPYDYWSVMHYSKYEFSIGNGSTIITKDPKFQNVIGQTLGMSPLDALELNLFYKCNSTIAFKMYCGFTNGTMCEMNHCSQSGNGWKIITQVHGGPSSDHTNLPSGNNNNSQETGYFMHASTASGLEGDSARLETQRMDLRRECNAQCLQFYYYHSGNKSDELNIWIREFQDGQDPTGTLRLMGHITGPPTSHWKLQHVSLNATKQFQVVFEARKGAGNSTGGFSVDDISLSETECPHVTLQIDEFEKLFNSTSDNKTIIYSPRQYSKEGYAYRAAASINKTFVGLYVQLVSGDSDNELEWPCLRRQITLQMLDQTPNFQLQMSKQRSFTTGQNQAISNGTVYWTNPRETGEQIVDENEGLIYVGPLVGLHKFTSLEEMQLRDFLKGGSAIFTFNFQDLTPLVNGSTLPCPQVKPVNATQVATHRDESPCPSWTLSTTVPPKTTVKSLAPEMAASPALTFLLVLKLLEL